MKARFALTMLFVFSLLILKSSLAQNEIEKYKQPELIKGSNLYVSGSPVFFNTYQNDSSTHKNFGANLSAQYLKWKFTRRLNYSADIRPSGSFNWSSSDEPRYSNSQISTDAFLRVTGGLGYYPVKDRLYGGFYINSSSYFANNYKPTSANYIYGYAGTGILINAGQTLYSINFSKVLMDEGLTSKALPMRLVKKFTELLDKRRNSEFSSKYHDDADIEFFSRIENLLRDEKIISGPLSSRTTLKLFQALTNPSFVYFPRYKGYLLQAELSFSNENYRYSYKQGNALRLILSGVYGLPVGLNTNLVFSCFAGVPLNKEYGALLDRPFFHSPLILRDNSDSYYPSPFLRLDTEKYKFTGGIKLLAYHNISQMMGISALANMGYGKSEDEKDKFVFYALVNFKYNILSRMVLNTTAEFDRFQNREINFVTMFEISYIVF